MRKAMLALVAAVVCFGFYLAIGAAVDAEVQDRIVFTRGGVTFDCERRFVPEGEPIVFEDDSSVLAREGGEYAYGNCHTVP